MAGQVTWDAVLKDVAEWKRDHNNGWKAFCRFIYFLCFITGIVLLSISLKRVNATEFAVYYNRYTKNLVEEPLGQGLKGGAPGFHLFKFKSVQQSLSVSELCNSVDGLEIEIAASFQYVVQREHAYDSIVEFNNPESQIELLVSGAKSSVHHACGMYMMKDFQEKRGEVQSTMQDYIQNRATFLYIDIGDVQLNNVNGPEAWRQAIKDKEGAREDVQVAINEREKDLTEANTQLRLATEQAQIILENAQKNADVISLQASAVAQSYTIEFQNEALTVSQIMDNLDLDEEGVLTYLTNRALEKQKNIKVSLSKPAKDSFIP